MINWLIMVMLFMVVLTMMVCVYSFYHLFSFNKCLGIIHNKIVQYFSVTNATSGSQTDAHKKADDTISLVYAVLNSRGKHMEWLIAVKEVVFAVFLPKKFVKNRTTYLRFLYNHELMLLITYFEYCYRFNEYHIPSQSVCNKE